MKLHISVPAEHYERFEASRRAGPDEEIVSVICPECEMTSEVAIKDLRDVCPSCTCGDYLCLPAMVLLEGDVQVGWTTERVILRWTIDEVLENRAPNRWWMLWWFLCREREGLYDEVLEALRGEHPLVDVYGQLMTAFAAVRGSDADGILFDALDGMSQDVIFNRRPSAYRLDPTEEDEFTSVLLARRCDRVAEKFFDYHQVPTELAVTIKGDWGEVMSDAPAAFGVDLARQWADLLSRVDRHLFPGVAFGAYVSIM
ncbi:MAG: hypothetical protein P1P84_08765 [Deferrisomatales bacterium]|nr:hypothetical protein [Deferrisomatales bacterium]